jgi:RNA methyltransferase, TrmH family
MQDITSPDNPKIKHIKKLIQNTSYRNSHSQCIIEGTRFVSDNFIKYPQHIDSIYIQVRPENSPNNNNDIFKTNPENQHIAIYQLPEPVFKSISTLKQSSGTIALCNIPKTDPSVILQKTTKKACLLDQLQNPSNIGAIIRNATAFNLDAILYTPNTADPYHHESIRAAAGNIFQTPIIECTPELFKNLQSEFTFYLLSTRAKQTINNTSFEEKSIFILGSEGAGIKTDFIQNHKHIIPITIPTNPKVDSLNVATTSGILFFLCQTLC